MPKNRLGAFTLAIGMGLITPVGVVCAQAPTADIPAAPRFDIGRFAVDGNTLLKPEDIERAVAPYVGKQKDFGDIQRALEAIEQLYRDRGYGVVQVQLPEQDITRGVVQLRVIEVRIAKVTVEGNQNFDTANVRASLPGIKPGVTPNSLQIARNLQLLAEHPAKQTTVLLRAGATESEVDAVVRVTDEKPLKFVVTLDNSGTDATGRFRTGFGMQHANMFNRDHILNLQYVTNPEHPSKVSIYGAGYRIPFYAYNSTFDLFAGYSDVDSGTLQTPSGDLSVSGAGTILGARYNLYLPRFRELEHKLAFGLDYRAFKNQVAEVTSGLPLIGDITVHPASITYSGLWRMTDREIGMYLSVAQNIFPGGNDGADSDFKACTPPGLLCSQRADAKAGYRIYRYGATFTQSFAKEWQLRAALNGQHSEHSLVAGEQFGFGGPDSVRGFNNREVSNDKGYAANFEVYTPELSSKLGWKWKDVKARLLAFYDIGSTNRNDSDNPPGEFGSSVGFGLRLASGKNLSLRFDFAQVVNSAGSQKKDDQMLNASMAFAF